MALTQLEVPAASASEHPRTSDATTPSSLAAEQIRLDLRTPMAQLHQAIAEQEQRAINGTLERRGILPHTSIAGADHPSPAAQTVKPSDMADDAKRLHTGLGQLHDWTGRSNHNIEKDLRDTLATMNSTQIAALRSEYKTLYGSDVKDALMADKELSTESKQTLAIYLKGADQRKPNDSLALAEIGTRARNLDMFEEAFRDAAPEARTQYLASGGEAKVKEAFGGIFSDRDVRHAMDYVKGGRLSVETQVEDNTGVFSSNRQAIEHTLSKMTADQKAQYERGEALDKTVPEYIRNGRYSRPNTEGFNKLAADQQADLTYFRQTHSAFVSAGNRADLTKWEGEIKGQPVSPGAAPAKPGADQTNAAPATQPNTVEGSREAFNKSREQEYKSNDGIGRAVVRNLWDGTSEMSTDELNQYAADMSRSAAAGQTLSQAKQQEHSQEVDQTVDLLKKSKTAAADTVVDGTMIVAGVGGAAFTGGASLALLGAVGAGGAAVKIGAKAAIVGSDYNFTAGQVLSDGASGAVNAAAMLVGPAQIARVIGIGGKVAVSAAVDTATAAAVKTTEVAATSLATDVALNSAAGAVAGTASGAVEGVTKWDRSKSVGGNLAEVGETALIRGATGAVLAGVMSGAIGGVSRLARTGEVAPVQVVRNGAPLPVAGEAVPATLAPEVAALPAVAEVAALPVLKEVAPALGNVAPVAAVSEKAALPVASEAAPVQALTDKATVPAAAEKAPAAGGETPVSERDIDGRPHSESQPRREVIESKFAPVAEGDKKALREKVQEEMGDVKATGPDGKPTSAYDSLMKDPTLSDPQKENILANLGMVREHFASYRLGDRMHPDPEVNWIHTQGELAKELQVGRANHLSADELEDSLLASMYSDSVKFSAPSPEGTTPNFYTHHMDGALAADHSLRLQGYPTERVNRIVESILAHQVAPPEFMGELYYMKINGVLDGMIKSGKVSAEEGQSMRDVLTTMTEVGADGKKRIRQLADGLDAPRTTNAEGMQQVDFTPEEQKVFALSGTDRWILPYDTKFDPQFNDLSAAEKEVRLSRQRIARNLADGDAIDNYGTTGGASKIVAIRGPETYFPDKTVWDSIDSIDASFKDAYNILTPEAQKIASESLASRNLVTDRQNGSLKTYMDGWLKEKKGLDASKDNIPFYNHALTYAKPGEVLTPEQASQMQLAKEIRAEVVDFLRRDHRVDNSLPGNFPAVRTAPAH